MNKNIVLTAICLLVTLSSFAGIFRVGYPGTARVGVDFPHTNIAGAMAAASAGDTIQLYQQYWPGAPGTVNVSKPLKFIGFGYFLDKNPGLLPITSPDVSLLMINFNAGSAGSVITGAYIKPAINASNISIIRCKILDCVILNNLPLTNLTFLQCFMYAQNSFLCCPNQYACIRENGDSSLNNIYIVNNYMFDQIVLPHSSGAFFNNVVLQSAPTLYSFIVKNNIFSTACPSLYSNTVHHNLFSCNGASTVPGTSNVFHVNMNSVFVNWNGGAIQADSQLVLKTGSPAIGAGIKNDSTTTDAGIFGGESGEIYRLSGIPSVPSIYQISALATAITNPYNITISVRSNN